MSRLYGAFLQLAKRCCLVVGGGPVAERKLAGLLECGAQVTVIAPEVTEAIRKQAESGAIAWEARAYRAEDAASYFLIIAATSSQKVNAQVYADGERAGRLVNVVNDQELGHFVVPAMVRRGRLSIAVSTSGASPAVARKIKRELEEQFGEEYAIYLDQLADVRRTLLQTVEDEKRRTEIFQRIAASDLLRLLRNKEYKLAEQLIDNFMGGLQE